MRCVEVGKLLQIIEKVANREYERDNWRGVLDAVADLFEADGAAIGEIKEGYIYYSRVSSLLAEREDYDPEVFKVPLQRSAAGEALLKGYAVINDYQAYEGAVEAWKSLGLKAMVVAIFGVDEPLGSLALGRLESGKPFTEEDGKVLKSLAFVFSFIIKQEIEKGELFERATRDHLTKLYNRLYFEEVWVKELERARRYGYPLSVVMFDLDDFKWVNDTFGHQKGDQVLSAFGEVVRGSIRITDIPVRYGGEEFLLLLPHTDAEEAFKIAERIRERFSRFVFFEEGKIFGLTVSAGVASCEGEDCQLESLLYKADIALYQAKKEGKNRSVVFSRKDKGH